MGCGGRRFNFGHSVSMIIIEEHAGRGVQPYSLSPSSANLDKGQSCSTSMRHVAILPIRPELVNDGEI